MMRGQAKFQHYRRAGLLPGGPGCRCIDPQSRGSAPA